VLTAGVSLSLSDYGPPSELTKRAGAFFQKALIRIGSLPGVASVGMISHLPLGGRGVNMTFELKSQSHLAAKNDPVADWRIVSPSYFNVLRIPLRMGRVMTERDTDTTPPVTVINETFARRYFSGRSPLGERLKVGGWESEIVGVVGDVRHRGLETEPLPEIYTSYLQKTNFPVMNFVIRVNSDPASLATGVRRELQAIDPRQPVYNVQPMAQLFSASIAERRFNLLLLVAFAALAASLAASGIYSVISYAVAERTREIGIRMALGAQGGEILKLMVRQGMKSALVGMVLGLLASFSLTRLMKSLLFGVEATDPMIFGVVMLMVALVALLACYIPGRRATKVDPIAVLKSE
jgi:putative ABC transport system permease protein